MEKNLFRRWQANFWAGLAIVLPALVSVGAVIWVFGTVSRITDILLFFLPSDLSHRPSGEMYWYWSLVALGMAVVLICCVGLLARNYFGKRIIEWVDLTLLRVPLLNKLYSASKQVNDAFSSTNKTAFRTVVLVEFPRPGVYAMGFITGEQHVEVQAKTKDKGVCVFVPTTPNPTGGFLLMLPESEVTKLDMSVADGIKYIISLGSILPESALTLPRAGREPESQLTSVGHD